MAVLAVQKAEKADGQPLAVFASYALHYVGGMPGDQVSADYFGAVGDRLFELLPAPRRDTVQPFVPILANACFGDINNIDVRRAVKAAYAYLAAQPNVKKDRIGAIGWCMGGGYSLDAALAEPGLAADVINYGRLATDPDELKKIQAPILGLFGGQDRGITPEDVKKFQAAMEKLGKKIDVKIYPNAGHAFENPNNKQGYRAEDAADAWLRTLAFLAGTLKK